MDVEAIASVPTPRAAAPAGVTAELATARKQLRDATPAGSWDGVLAEVKRLQLAEHMAPLQAMKTVYAKLASGWQPPTSRSV